MTLPRPSAAWLGALCALTLGACSPEAPAETEPEADSPPVLAAPDPPLPDVVLVVLDTVRADHLSCYGYERPTTPVIDALAERATRYTRAFASAPWTLPSHASLFTGLDPSEHGVQTVRTPTGRVGARPLEEEHFTLAEGLAELGYRTGAFVANFSYLSEKYGLGQGFETYWVERQSGLGLNRDIATWLDEPDPRPIFLFVNYVDAHRPYVTYPRPEVVPEPVNRAGSQLLDELVETVLPGEQDPPAELVQGVIDQYDLGVAACDEAVGRLLELLESRTNEAGRVVVVTSDHGEYFGEHRLVEHSKDVYQPALWVPLIVKARGQASGRVDDRVLVSADVPRLVLEAMEDPRAGALRERFPRREGIPPRAANAYTREKDYHDERWGHRFRRIRHVTFEWPYKYIHSSDGQHELYDLEQDPGELDNLIEEEPELAARLAEVLRSAPARSDTDTELPEMSPEELERMRAMGYVE